MEGLRPGESFGGALVAGAQGVLVARHAGYRKMVFPTVGRTIFRPGGVIHNNARPYREPQVVVMREDLGPPFLRILALERRDSPIAMVRE
jgi:hypothetical protein